MQRTAQSSSLSPRYQISLRKLLKIKKEPEDENKFETWKQIDDYFQTCTQDQQLSNPNTSRTSIKLDQKVNQSYLEYFNKMQKEMKQEAFTTIIKSCSEYFIDTLYLALIGETVSDKYEQLGTISQILLGFGIQPSVLKNLNENEKKDYIISKFNKTIDQLMQRWKERVESRQQQQITTKVETKILPEPLKWLSINTKYQSLKIPLAQALYRKLDELQDLKELIQQQKQIKLNDITRPTILELIKRIDPQIGKLFIKLNSQKNIDPNKQSKREDKSPSNNIQRKMQNFEWNSELEMAFLLNRQKSQNQFSNKISTCNFNVMGYLPLIQTLNRRKAQISQNQEEEIIYHEIKFAKSFSKFLARCVDKKQLQNAVNLIDKDQISALEGNLAEQIIETHQQIVRIIQQTRYEFLNNKTQQLQLQSKLFSNKLLKKERSKSSKQDLKTKIKRFTTIFKKNSYYNFYTIYFGRIISRKVKILRKRKVKPIQNCFLVKKACRNSRSPEQRERCITSTSTGPLRFKPSNRNKLQMLIKVQALIRRFLAQRFYKKLFKWKIKKLQKIYKHLRSIKT